MTETEDLVSRIKRLYERDRASGRRAVDPSELPIDYDAITSEWLTHIICKGHPGARVVRHRLDEKDDGSANRRRIFLEYNEEGYRARLPKSVFCKASHELLNRINLGICGAAHAEVTFYNKVRPLLQLEIPRAIYAGFDEESCNSLIMLHDLAGQAEFCRHTTTITRKEVEGQVALMAAYHSQLQENPSCNTRTTALTTFPAFFRACEQNGLEEYSNKGFRTAEAVIPARLFARYDEIWPATVRSVDIHESLPSTLVHGDCHLKQWYKTGGNMGLTDWQNATFANWSRDYAYAVTTSLEVEDRRKWERELLEYYLDRLKAGGAAAPGFDEAWRLYRMNMMSALCWWTVTLTPSPGMPDMQPEDTSIEFIRRMAHAIDDLDVLDLFRD